MLLAQEVQAREAGQLPTPGASRARGQVGGTVPGSRSSATQDSQGSSVLFTMSAMQTPRGPGKLASTYDRCEQRQMLPASSRKQPSTPSGPPLARGVAEEGTTRTWRGDCLPSSRWGQGEGVAGEQPQVLVHSGCHRLFSKCP